MTDTRARLVTATNELFRQRGYHGTSIKDVTAAAGATTGSLYHFFPDGKAELARSVLLETGAAYQQLFELIADDAGGGVDAVRAFFDGAADVLEATDYLDICPIGTVAREVAGSDESLRVACASVFGDWTEALASRLRVAGIEGQEAERLSISVIALLEGSFLLARTLRDATVVRSAGRDAVELLGARVSRGSGRASGPIVARRRGR